jgi:pimeloyl-ACP methyl ester carboxylesterase
MSELLHHVRGGAPAEPVLLLIHPMGSDLRFWDACRAIWEPRWNCLAVDLRGSGGSPAGGEALSIGNHAGDLAGLVDALAIGRAVPVGCAVGAMVAVAFAGLHPGRCAGLVLSNPGFRTGPEARAMLAARAAAVRAAGMAAVLPGAVDAAFEGCPRDAGYRTWLARFAAQEPEAYARQIEGVLEADVAPSLGAIDVPTLIVAGGRDRLLPVEQARAVAAGIAGSEIVEMPEAAHFIPWQRPAEFAARVGAFLDRLAGGVGG